MMEKHLYKTTSSYEEAKRKIASKELPNITLAPKKTPAKQFFHLPKDCILQCYSFLTEGEILLQQGISKIACDFISNSDGVFANCKNLVFNQKWASLPIKKRQNYWKQMTNLETLYIAPESFIENGVFIQEVAAVIFLNYNSLRVIKLYSPDNPLLDDTPKHDPFCLTPVTFPRLTQLAICGSQALEWLHIFGNCNTPAVRKFEISHFSLPPGHWSWDVLYDFTILGVAGLHRLLDTMGELERLTVGLDVWFESSTTHTAPEGAHTSRLGLNFSNIFGAMGTRGRPYEPDTGLPAAASSSTSASAPAQSLNEEYSDESELLAAESSWVDRGVLRSYKGKLSEEDYGDIFAICFVRAGQPGNLNRIVLKYRVRNDADVEEEEEISSFSEFVSGTASFCQRYITGIVRNFPTFSL